MNLKKFYPQRDPWSHKGQFGYVLIVAGSQRYSGSPVFNSLAALRAGADLVTLIGHKRAMDIAATFAPDIIAYPLDSSLEPRHLPKILSLIKNFQALIVGCGLERNRRSYQTIRKLIQKVALPLVVDAEAIRAVAEDKGVIRGKRIIITSHSEEFKILTGETVKSSLDDRRQKVKKWAAKLKTVILLKGHIDVISDGRRVVLNKTGSVFMTKGGFGDTLSGIAGALLSRGIEPLAAAQVAAYINGRAGELASQKFGVGVLASDIFDFIPVVINKG